MHERTRLTARWPWAILAAAGAALGWWTFHDRGAALFGGTALGAAAGFRFLSHYSGRIAAALTLAVAAHALHSASTLGWGGTDVPGGSRFKASPVGLSHVLAPDRFESGTVDCGWHAVSGYRTLCEIGDARAFARLRAVYPITLLAALLSVAGAISALVRHPRARAARRGLAGAAGLAALTALGLFAGSVRPALAAIADLPVGVGGTLGTMQLVLALLLCLVIAIGPPLLREVAQLPAVTHDS